jgi:thiopeptide-type bacteriocin biosynthesis protein
MVPGGVAAMNEAGRAEEERTPGHIWAELVYYPSSMRSANVIVRPAVRRYEIPLAATPNPEADVIPWQELVVGVADNRFYLRWPACGKRVVVTSGHMLNMHHAPPVGRFMVDLSHDATPIMSTFEWGPAESFPYLPRVQHGRVVLRPAQWMIGSDDVATGSNEDFLASLNGWRADWDVPRYVCLSVGDNRLVVDLDSRDQALEIKLELQGAGAGRSVLLQEVLPAFDEVWLDGPGGAYVAEFVVSLIRREPVKPPENGPGECASATAPSVAVQRPAAVPGVTAEKYRPPGTEWLFVKIYCERQDEDALLSGPVRGLAQAVLVSGKADRFFVIRYSDPDPHIRIRFYGDPGELTNEVYPLVCDWANALLAERMCRRFVFDSYEQETDRFGGPAGLDVAHEIFCSDSQAALDLLALVERKQWPDDRMTLVLLSIDLLLASIGLDDRARLEWYGRETTKGDENAGADYRARKNVLRSALGRGAGYAPDFRDVFESRAAALAPAGERLRRLSQQRELTTSLDRLYSTFVHLHVNRLGGLDGPAEQRAFMLLLRARDSLAKAPLRS